MVPNFILRWTLCLLVGAGLFASLIAIASIENRQPSSMTPKSTETLPLDHDPTQEASVVYQDDEPDYVEVLIDEGFGGRKGVTKRVLTRTGRAKLGEKLRQEYPIITLNPRLAKLKRPAIQPHHSQVDLTEYFEDLRYDERESAYPKAGRNYPAQEGFGWERMRSRALERLHSQCVNDFIDTEGFGSKRMPGEPEDFIVLPKESAFFAEDGPTSTADSTKKEMGVSKGLPSPSEPAVAAFMDMLSNHQDGFARVRTFGNFIDLDRVAGFRPHSFLRRPKMTISASISPGQPDADWKIFRLELVSLLMHDEPVVYVSKSLPRMSELAEHPVTRGLDEFEQTALAKLEAGENVVYRATLNQIEMVGAIRAVNQCLQCHEVQRGALLGAFSYSLFRDPPAEVPERAAVSVRE